MPDKALSPIERFLAKANARLEYRNRPPVSWQYQKKCGALARSTGKPCERKAMRNGRCRNHGGLSTGPKTPKGKACALANLRQYKSNASTNTKQG